MYTTIAVEDGLGNVIQALHNAGFKTAPLEGPPFKNIRAVVLKGDGKDVFTPEWDDKLPVINAAGRSADEIVDVLRDRLS